ncbi:MAG: sensor histidine kinase [Alphaproteobacteria bacterium]
MSSAGDLVQTLSTSMGVVVNTPKVGNQDFGITVDTHEFEFKHDLGELCLIIPRQSENNPQQESFDMFSKLVRKITHDIKGHQRRILLYTELLNQGSDQPDPDDLKDTMEIVTKNASETSELITSVSDYIKLFGEPKSTESIDMQNLFDEILDDLDAHIQKTKAIIEFGDYPGSIVGVYSETRALFIQLLRNAILHNEIDPKIFISGEVQKTGFEFTITDDGPGIPANNYQRIFDPLVSTSDVKDTLGLGLALVKKIIERANGKLWIASEEGTGTQIKIYLPFTSIGEEDGS